MLFKSADNLGWPFIPLTSHHAFQVSWSFGESVFFLQYATMLFKSTDSRWRATVLTKLYVTGTLTMCKAVNRATLLFIYINVISDLEKIERSTFWTISHYFIISVAGQTIIDTVKSKLVFDHIEVNCLYSTIGYFLRSADRRWWANI